MNRLVPTLFILIILFTNAFCQDKEKSNLLNYTPSKLLKNNQMDYKIFNNLYTQTKGVDDQGKISKNLERQNFFTSTLETYRGVSENRKINIGLILNIKSNNGNNKDPLTVFNFESENNISSVGITSIAPAIKIAPFKKIAHFSLQTAFHIPIFQDNPNGFFLDKRSYILETKFFFDHTFNGDKFQIFSEVDITFFFGAKPDFNNSQINNSERFANNSLALPFSLFFSYFITNKFTIYVNGQHYTLVPVSDGFNQNFSLAGLGIKYQLTNKLNLELSHARFLRGNSTGLGETYNLGLRFLN